MTPGCAANSRSTASNTCGRARASSRSSSGINLKVTIDSVRRPKSTRAMLTRLCVNNAASTSNDIDNAICAVASVKRNRPRFLPPNARAPFALQCAHRIGRRRASISAAARTRRRETPRSRRRPRRHADPDSTSTTLNPCGCNVSIARSTPRRRASSATPQQPASNSASTDKSAYEPAPRGAERRTHGDLADLAPRRARTSDSRGSRKPISRIVAVAAKKIASGVRARSRALPSGRAPRTRARGVRRAKRVDVELPVGARAAASGRVDVGDERAIRRVQPRLAPRSIATPGFSRPNT